MPSRRQRRGALGATPLKTERLVQQPAAHIERIEVFAIPPVEAPTFENGTAMSISKTPAPPTQVPTDQLEDVSDFERLAHHIFGDQTGYVYVWSGVRTKPTATQLLFPHRRFFPYPAAIGHAWEWA